jgi:phage terminase large subunit-like protein
VSESQRLRRKIAIEKKLQRTKESLPHLYGIDWYPFQKEFLETTKEVQFLCCANQIGKSTVLCAKLVKYATDQGLWGELWQDKPDTFAYLLPNQRLHNENARTKWASVLPQNEFKDDEYWGWDFDKRGRDFRGITFRNGVKILFLSYGQNIHCLQNLTCHVVAFDEEPDWEIVPEVQTRTESIKVARPNIKNAWGGFKMFAFTATKSQNFFREVLEETGPKERWPVSQGNVWKKTVSLFDCQKHVSGKDSVWTTEKIHSIIKSLPTEAEIARRVYGRFQASESLVYPQYTRAGNNIDYVPPLPGYNYYAGIDYGSGGTAHPSSIVFVAVNPEYTKAYVTDVWLGDDGQLTTCSDVIEKYRSMIKGRNVVQAFYDWGAKDLHTFAMRAGLTLSRANKDHKIGEDTLNGLFKHEMLWICDTDYYSNILCTQLTTFVKKAKSKKVFDDAIDALRYAVSSIPWDFSNAGKVTHEEQAEIAEAATGGYQSLGRDGKPRRQRGSGENGAFYEEELSEWGEYFNGF